MTLITLFCCLFIVYFDRLTPFSSVFIINFEQINTCKDDHFNNNSDNSHDEEVDRNRDYSLSYYCFYMEDSVSK